MSAFIAIDSSKFFLFLTPSHQIILSHSAFSFLLSDVKKFYGAFLHIYIDAKVIN